MSDQPIVVVMSSLVPPERKTIADLVDEVAAPSADLGSAIEQQCAQWEAKLAIERGNSAQLLAASTRCTEVATKARASAVEVRAVGGPVAETAALHLEAVARSLSDLAFAAGVTALAAFATEGE